MNKSFWKFLQFIPTVVIRACEGEGEGEKKEEKPPEQKPDPSKKFTDNDMKNMRVKHEAELKKATDRERQLQNDQRLTQEERDEAKKRADELETKWMTDKQLADQQLARASKDAKEKEETLTKERDTYKLSYHGLLIENELGTEAALAEELIPGQLKKILKPDAILVDELIVEGDKTTKKQVVRINFEDIDKDNKPIKLQLSVKDALKRMKELPERFGNFFKGIGTGGVGSGNGKGNGPAGEMPTDTEAYVTQRNKNRPAFGSK